MNIRMSLKITLLSSLISGCSSWPEHGRGGLAESHLESYIPVEAEHELTYEHGLRFDFEFTRRQLDMLILRGADRCFPASVVQAKQRQLRISRELIGGLFFDAANDVLIQRELLARLERQLNYVLEHGACDPKSFISSNIVGNALVGAERNTYSADDPGKGNVYRDNNLSENTVSLNNVSRILFDLLNSDNQFAVGSFQLNPKYIGNLAEAAVILREHSNLSMIITGHADLSGSVKNNENLSLQRANQVARYLGVMGIASSRIETTAVGESSPLFFGQQDHIRLVNRRVSIEVFDENALSPELKHTVIREEKPHLPQRAFSQSNAESPLNREN